MANKTPTHVVYLLPQRDRDSSWKALGSGWRNKDGSINVVLNDRIGRGARLQLRRRTQSLEAMAADRAAQLEAELADRRAARAAPPLSAGPAPSPNLRTEPPTSPRGGGVHTW